MARQVLPTNFKDDVLAASMNGKRRYILTENADGTFSLEDATTYTQVGDVFGQARLNAICKAINESVDQAKVVDDIDDIKAITQPGYVPGTLPFKQVISDLTAADGEKFRYGKTADGQRGIIITGEDGADTVIPFRSSNWNEITTGSIGSTQSLNYTFDHDYRTVIMIFAGRRDSATLNFSALLNGAEMQEILNTTNNSASSIERLAIYRVENVKAGDVLMLTHTTSSVASIVYALYDI